MHVISAQQWCAQAQGFLPAFLRDSQVGVLFSLYHEAYMVIQKPPNIHPQKAGKAHWAVEEEAMC